MIPKPSSKGKKPRHCSGEFFLLKIALLCLAIFYISSSPLPVYVADAKEIVATKEWQKLQEGDTIPKGLHIKMDFETGNKWVKLLDESECENETDGNGNRRHVVSSSLVITDDGSVEEIQDSDKLQSSTTLYDETVKITQLANAELSADASAKVTSQLMEQSRKANLKASIAALDDFKGDKSLGETDIEMMYRTLSSLPEEEHESMGMGLPLPLEEDATDGEKRGFEIQVRMIWSARQALLKKMEEEYLADVTDLMAERISSLTDYVSNPMKDVRDILIMEAEERESDLSTITGVLEDLEFQLTDLDNARDFHDMGGWPLLVAVLTDSIHGLEYEIEQAVVLQAQDLHVEKFNGTEPLSIELSKDTLSFLQDYQKVVWKIQGLACWCIGTAVKTVEEFHPWALEDFSDLMALNSDGGIVNVITIILNKLHSESTRGPSILDMPLNDDRLQLRRKYEMYALGSLLRGNRGAIDYFGSVGGPSALFDLYGYLTAEQNIMSMDKTTLKLLEKVIILADDIIMDVKLHPSDRPENDEFLITAFTTDEWCSVPIDMFYHGSAHIQMRMLGILMNMSTSCNYRARALFTTTKMKDAAVNDEEVQALMSKFEETIE